MSNVICLATFRATRKIETIEVLPLADPTSYMEQQSAPKLDEEIQYWERVTHLQDRMRQGYVSARDIAEILGVK